MPGDYIFEAKTSARQLTMKNWMVITIPTLVNNTKDVIIREAYGHKFLIEASNWNTESGTPSIHNSFFSGLARDGNPYVERADLTGLETGDVTHLRNFFRKTITYGNYMSMDWIPLMF